MQSSQTVKSMKQGSTNVNRHTYENRVQADLIRRDLKLREISERPLRNAYRLQSVPKRDFGPNVEDAYKDTNLGRLTTIELILTLSTMLVAMAAAIGALYMPILLIITVIVGWFSTICYRFYSHHMKCYRYLLYLEAEKSPHCGEVMVSTEEYVREGPSRGVESIFGYGLTHR